MTTWLPEWRGVPATALSRLLDPPTGPPLQIRGSALSVTVADVAAGMVEPFPTQSRPRLDVVVATAKGWQTATLGPIRSGRLATASGALHCATGCRLIAFTISNPDVPTPVPYGVSFSISSMSTDLQTADTFKGWLADAGRWRQKLSDQTDPRRAATVQVKDGGAGLRLIVDDVDGGFTTSWSRDWAGRGPGDRSAQHGPCSVRRSSARGLRQFDESNAAPPAHRR